MEFKQECCMLNSIILQKHRRRRWMGEGWGEGFTPTELKNIDNHN